MAKARSIEADLIQSLTEAAAFVKGVRKGFRVHVLSPDDVRLIRATTKKSQAEFSASYRIPLRTLQKWERGETKPAGTAAALLQVIRSNPRVVEKALEEVA
ncbi:helix-turn-helix domain-containing protein [Dongia sp.]|uniref:helix-turn-helix domain-containing protein n=1 Tax=Dongia sp. TaxID=1977262 RepID=UPI0035AE18CD